MRKFFHVLSLLEYSLNIAYLYQIVGDNRRLKDHVTVRKALEILFKCGELRPEEYNRVYDYCQRKRLLALPHAALRQVDWDHLWMNTTGVNVVKFLKLDSQD